MFPLYDLNPHHRFPIFTLLIIVANFVVTASMWTLPEPKQNRIALEYGFVPARLSNVGEERGIAVPVLAISEISGKPVQIGVEKLSTNPQDVYTTFLTTMFLHGGWGHLLMNMWMLWIFGNNIEDRLGHVMYVVFYLLGGVLATLAFWASDPNGATPVIGASGAVAAVLGGYLVTFPHAKVRTLIFIVIFFTIVDMPALVLLGLWFALQVVSGLMGMWGVVLEPVAFWAHIGGFVVGMILMPLFRLVTTPPKQTEELEIFDDRRFT